uniref:Translation elongation factor EF1B beta/delta subunit guanine nucleotide exchange domain-containing protein n=1 Tax=Aplanochytrium stocchinoi TaxID=215587 RepID=A0A7S3PN23_9STRA|mmetsp:Transcript_300/g.329  ORF Transcript_300/g.329 Transcript_300/m.329 type:complete len:162 (-) Transcript_300:174-659(-)
MSTESAQAAEAVKEEVKPAATEDAEEDDVFGDDDDLFAEDDDPEAAAAAAALKEKLYLEAKKRGEEKLQKSKSMIVLEIKPYETDFDLEELAQGIKAMTHEGIQNWGEQHKLEPVAFGIKKLVMSVIVHDTKVSVDDITDMINEKYEDDVQSIDVQSMSKV